MRILFIHEGPGQFEKLHLELNQAGLAHSWMMCSDGVYKSKKDQIPNLCGFTVPSENPKTYFYTKNLEARIQRSFYIKKSIDSLLEKTGIDLIVTHGSGGFPLQLFGEFDIPIITYIEFPSFTCHGYDSNYPQPDYATYRDKVFEMASFHQALKSDLVITPSKYSKAMFPTSLHEKIIPQMEGFDIKRSATRFQKEEGFFYIGFSARDLSSAKGFEKFILVAKKILERRKNVKFVFCGGAKSLYSYESEFLKKSFQDSDRPESFMEYLLKRENIEITDSGPFQHLKYTTYEDFASYIEAMDLFLYPLQFGSANWGLFELLFRGRKVIASERCFIPEVVKHNHNGLICRYDDEQEWVEKSISIIDEPDKFDYLGKNAEEDAIKRFHIKKVVDRYLDIFNYAILRRKLLETS